MEEDQNSVQDTSNQSSPSFLQSILSFIGLLFKKFFQVIGRIFKAFFNFFFRLSFGSKLIFLAFIIIFMVVFFLIGYFMGKNDGQEEIKGDFEEMTNFDYDNLDEFVEETDSLREQLDRVRGN